MRLLLHIGLGKTGTIAFQRFCHMNVDVLRASGYLYGGVFLQDIAPTLLSHQDQATQSKALSDALPKLDAVLQDRPRDAEALIWSNEAFSMGRQPEEVIEVIDEYVRSSRVFDGWEVFVVLRRQDQWIETAYKQWALKHKTYTGRRIMSAQEYVDSVGYLLDYDELVSKWRRSSALVHACSYDAVMQGGGIVDYLVQRMDLRLPSDRLTDPGQVHESLDNDLSMLMAIYNQAFETPRDPQQFLALLRNSGLTSDLHPSDECFVSTELRQEILNRYSDSNARLESEHFSGGETFNREPVAERPLYEVDTPRILSRMLQILVNQQSRLERQNKRIRKLESLRGVEDGTGKQT